MCITRMRECVHAPQPGSMSSDEPNTHTFCLLHATSGKMAQLQLPLSLHCVHTVRGGGGGWVLGCFLCVWVPEIAMEHGAAHLTKAIYVNEKNLCFSVIWYGNSLQDGVSRLALFPVALVCAVCNSSFLCKRRAH
jgi:hypothetical protein